MLVETPEFRRRPAGFEYLPAWTASEMLIGEVARGGGRPAHDGGDRGALLCHERGDSPDAGARRGQVARERQIALAVPDGAAREAGRAPRRPAPRARGRGPDGPASERRRTQGGDSRTATGSARGRRPRSRSRSFTTPSSPLPQYADCAKRSAPPSPSMATTSTVTFRCRRRSADLVREPGRARGEPTSAASSASSTRTPGPPRAPAEVLTRPRPRRATTRPGRGAPRRPSPRRPATAAAPRGAVASGAASTTNRTTRPEPAESERTMPITYVGNGTATQSPSDPPSTATRRRDYCRRTALTASTARPSTRLSRPLSTTSRSCWHRSRRPRLGFRRSCAPERAPSNAIRRRPLRLSEREHRPVGRELD